MADQRRGSAGKGMALVLAVLSLMLLHSELVEPRIFTVGDDAVNGWNTNARDWGLGKEFSQNDILVFNYAPGQHNVETVDAQGFANCQGSQNPVPGNGKDTITLQSGISYFICSMPGFCQQGMNLTVYASPSQ